MAVRITTPQTVNGQDYPSGMLVVGLDAREEEQLVQGGGAARVNLPPVSGGGYVSTTAYTSAAALEAAFPAASNSGKQGLVGSSAPYSVYVSNGTSWVQTGGSSGATPAASAFTSRALTTADNGAPLVCGGSQTATVNTGLGAGFGCSFKGTIAFSGTATVNDVRVSGAANPWCALVQTGTDAYDAVGSKA